MRRCILGLIFACVVRAEPADPAYAALEKAYAALRVRAYETAIASFEQAIAKSPNRASIYKDLAYTLLKVGETEAARDRFSQAMRLDPADEHVALEFAFLSYETQEQAAARRVFDRIRRTGNATAETAFRNIDGQLEEGIARWLRAVELSPGNFSAHQELARLAEQRDSTALAAEHYEAAWRLRPDLRAFLLDLGRVWKLAGRTAEANAALLAASRGAEPRTAEAARELLPSRYPYVYEFEEALRIDPDNANLRRELAYLLLEMGKKAEAEEQFKKLTELAPDDMLSTAQLGFLRYQRKDIQGAMPLLDRVLKSDEGELVDRVRSALNLPQVLRKRPDVSRATTSLQAKQLAERSLEAGYLKDALKYLRIAHENDPVDFSVMLKLGWTYNVLRDDRQAIEWFRLARRSPDLSIASEAGKAYGNLRPGLARFTTSAWAFPFYSSRWKDVFSYAQAKTEMKVGTLPLRVYASTRFAGDTRRTAEIGTVNIAPQYLSESSFIFGAGISTTAWKGARAWGEAGLAVSYLNRTDMGRTRPDYRGGVSFARGFGHNMGPESRGFFAEMTGDAVFVSRFDNDTLFYLQTKAGFTLPKLGPLQLQLLWNGNGTTDLRRYYWANTVEHGPGLRFHVDGTPPSVLFFVSALGGRYLKKEDSPLGRQYTDFRAGVWYAFSH